VGDEAIDFVLVACSFHFINRIADLLGLDSEVLPAPARRIEAVRRTGVWLASRMMRSFDLGNRTYERSYEQALADAAPVFARAAGRPLANEFENVRARPKIVEAVRLALAEREGSTLERATIARVHAVVEAALPRDLGEAEGLHARPGDPVDAFAFVGTRYPARTTRAMIDRLHEAGYDDVGILDLSIAVADANQWARTHRLLALDPTIFRLAASARPAHDAR
jgi:hypothetical protein